jgi:predicted DNA binding protein
LNESAVICLECPLNSESQPASWRFLARKGSDLRQILAGLKREGVEAQIEDISVLEPRSLLTARQKEIMAAALSHGFFEFPRRVSLTQLSELLGVQPSTLSEILRGAERRIMKNALGEPFEGY